MSRKKTKLLDEFVQSEEKPEHDLVCLVACKDTEQTLSALLKRHRALETREIKFKILTHPDKDPGCRKNSIEILRPFIKQSKFVVVIFDREGSGAEDSREDIETELEKTLSINGWEKKSCVIVNDPELENWVWSRSPMVSKIIGWEEEETTIQSWLVEKKFIFNNVTGKPNRPKEAMIEVLKHIRKPKSSSIFKDLAEKINFSGCTDPAFRKLLATLKAWFPILPNDEKQKN